LQYIFSTETSHGIKFKYFTTDYSALTFHWSDITTGTPMGLTSV